MVFDIGKSYHIVYGEKTTTRLVIFHSLEVYKYVSGKHIVQVCITLNKLLMFHSSEVYTKVVYGNHVHIVIMYFF